MRFSSFQNLVLCAIAIQSQSGAAADDDKKPLLPCTAHSANSGSFFDLRPLSKVLSGPEKKPSKYETTESWHSRGYDYGANFTLNICAPVLENVKDVVGIETQLWQNVSAYYEKDGKTYSMGQQSSNVTFRGRKLVLQYTNGSPCGLSRNSNREDNDDEKMDGHRRKSTLISFHCEKDALAVQPNPSFVGWDPDECTYMFELRSTAACGGAEPVQTGIGPGGVFGIIVLITVLVYFIGGIMYQRSVVHARGWRQLPNYSMWASIYSFIQDIFIIATSSCARLLPSRRGYQTLSISADDHRSGPRGVSGRPDDENRLIDQLDEEWDD